MYLILDQGGQSSRAAIIDASGKLCHLSQCSVATQYPRKNWVEQNPQEVVESLRQCLAELANTGLIGDVVSAGLVTQRSSMVCWHRETGEPLSPILSWQDTRGTSLLNAANLDSSTIRKLTGLYPSSHFGASKMQWCLKYIPAVKQAAQQGQLCMAPLSSFLLYKLCQEKPFLVDATNAQRTLLYNPEQKQWEPSLLQQFAIPQTVLPHIRQPLSQWGTLDLGSKVVPMSWVSGDQSAAFAALAGNTDDCAVINAGTGAFIAIPVKTGQSVPNKLLSTVLFDSNNNSSDTCNGGKSTKYIAEGTVNGAGRALQRIAQNLAVDSNDPAIRGALNSGEGATELLFLNGEGGLAAPFWLPDFASAFIGDGTAIEKLLAVQDSIVFLLYSNFLEMEQGACVVTELRVAGGLSQSDYFCQLHADLFQLPLSRCIMPEATALGAAWQLAGQPQWHHNTECFTSNPDCTALRERFNRWSNAMKLEAKKWHTA